MGDRVAGLIQAALAWGGLGLDNKSRRAWTVFVPAGEMSVLRFGAAPLGTRLRD